MKKKILTIILIIGMLLIGIKSYAGLQEAEQALQGVEGWAEEKLFIDSTLISSKNKVDKLEKLKDLSFRKMREYRSKGGTNNIIISSVYEYLYYKIIEVLNNSNSGGGAIVNNGSIPTPQTNNGKIPFNGKYVKVDALGNVQIRENGKRKYFFPKCIYGEDYYKNFSISETRLKTYKSQGFNCIVFRNAKNMAKAKTVGMKVMLQTEPYKDEDLPSNVKPGDGKGDIDFEENLRIIKNNGYQNTLLFYYTDYETSNIGHWSWHTKKKRLISQYDPNGHPMYFLNGKSKYAIDEDNHGRVSDITGSYVYERWGGFKPNGPTKIIELENSNQKQPVVMAQLNFGVQGEHIGRKFTPLAMAATAVGAKGLAYWRDKGSTGAGVEGHGFINDLKVFSRDIEKLMAMGLIQQSHRSFGVNCGQSDSAQIGAGTRKLNGIGYVILSNWNGNAKTMNCTIQNLGYTPSSLTDVLKGGNVGRVNGNSFSVQVPAYHRVVVKLNK